MEIEHIPIYEQQAVVEGMAKNAGDEGPCFKKPPSKENADGRRVDELPRVQMKQPKKHGRTQDGFMGRIATQKPPQEESPKQEFLGHGGHDNQGEN